MSVYLETDDFDLEFTKDEIAAEADVEKLRRYRSDIQSYTKELAIEIGAFKLGGIEQPDMCFKLGRLNIGLHWIERRLTQLGSEELNTRETRQAKQITELLRINEDLRAEIAALKSPEREAA